MKKVLLVGWTNHSLFHELYNKLQGKFCDEFQFDIFSVTNLGEWDLNSYGKVVDASFDGLKSGLWSKIPKLRKIIYEKRFKNEFKKMYRDYDYIHFHFIFQVYDRLFPLLNKFEGKTIATIWGSDFLRRSESAKKKNISFYNQVDLFTFANPTIRDDFFDYYLSLKKSHIDVRFGLSLFDYDLKMSKSECKEYFKFPINKTVIYVGTNGSKSQQHFKILEQFTSLASKEKEKFYLVVPLGYGVDESYRQQLQMRLNKLDIEFNIIEKYMHGKILAIFRKACDILIQLQTTDSLSGTMQEHIYFGSLVITGSWLPYNIFSSFGIYFHEIEDFPELPLLLKKTVLKNAENSLLLNKSKVKEISAWDANLLKWANCYELN